MDVRQNTIQENKNVPPKQNVLFYSIMFYSILFYSIMFYSVLFMYSERGHVLYPRWVSDERSFVHSDGTIHNDEDVVLCDVRNTLDAENLIYPKCGILRKLVKTLQPCICTRKPERLRHLARTEELISHRAELARTGPVSSW